MRRKGSTLADDLPIPSTFLTSDEIKDIIKAKLLGKREDHAEDEILKLCETNGIKGAKKNNIIRTG